MNSAERGTSVPLYCDGIQAGVIKSHVANTLVQYTHIFEDMREEGGGALRLVEGLVTVEQRTAALNSVFGDLRDKRVFSCLHGWRNEVHVCVTMETKCDRVVIIMLLLVIISTVLYIELL